MAAGNAVMGRRLPSPTGAIRSALRGTYRFAARHLPLAVGAYKALRCLTAPRIDQRRSIATGEMTVPDTRPICLMVFDRGFFAIESGSKRVLEAQLAMLRSIGFRIFAVVVHPASSVQFAPVTPEEVEKLGIDHAFETGPAAHWSTLVQLAWIMRPAQTRGQRSMRELRTSSEMTPVPVKLHESLKIQPPDVVFANYAWNVPLARRAAGEAPVLVETHDIQSRQIAYWRGEAAFARNWHNELAMLEQADISIALNSSEARFLAKELGEERVRLIYPPGYEGHISNDKQTPASAILASRPSLEVRNIHGNAQIALFVASRHDPNRVGLEWMVRDVLPVVRKQCPRVALVVAGSVAETLEPSLRRAIEEEESVYILGRVEDLAPLYAVAELVVVPIQAGAGVSIKTIEAMGFGKPIVTTSQGLRGFPESEHGVHDTAEEFATRMTVLLGSADARREAAALSKKLYEMHFSMTAYRTAYQKLFRDLGCLPKDRAMSLTTEGSRDQ